MGGLSSLFAPKSVAVVGASDDRTRIGGRTLAMVGSAGFSGPIYPVNPRRDSVQGLPAFPSLADIHGPVDCAVIAIPAAGVLGAIRDCAAKGVGTAIVFTAGFAELHDAGRALQQQITAVSRETGLRVLGPNCTGAFNLHTGAYLSFYDAGLRALVPGRRIGVVSQSGGYGAHIINLARGRALSVSQWVTTGNECDVEIGEVLAAFAADPGVDVLVGYVEGIRDAGTFLPALALARANGKPVVLLKAGRTAAGAAAAASHTASLAGFDAAYDAVFREFGVHRARTTEEVLDVAYAALGGKRPPDRRIAIMTNSGGMGVQIADFAADAGLEMQALPEAAQAKVLALNPNASPHNPVDITAQWLSEPNLIPDCMTILLDDCAVPALMLFMGSSGANPVVIEGVGSVMRRYPDRLVIMLVSVEPEVARVYEAMGCLVFQEPARAMTAVSALADFAAAFAAAGAAAAATQATAAAAATRANAAKAANRARAADAATRAVGPVVPPGSVLNERAAKQVLAAWGVPGPAETTAATPQHAAEIAASLAVPVSVKILSPDIAHKTDVGGVALALTGADAVREAATRMLEQVRRLRPDARLDGFLISPMLTDGVECIVGAHRDPVFGAMIMVGMGGIGVELQRDVAWHRAPVTPAQARHMIQSLTLHPLLTGYRGRPALDVDALASAVAAVSRLAAATAGHLRTVEVNPLLVRQDGVVALDAVIETSGGE